MKNFRIPDLPESQTRRLLEETRLSRLPKLPPRKPFNLDKKPYPKVCSVCSGELDADNEFQQSTQVCRKCIAHYTKVDAAFNDHAEQKARAARLASFT